MRASMIMGLLLLALLVPALRAGGTVVEDERIVTVLSAEDPWIVGAPSSDGAGFRAWIVEAGTEALAQLHGEGREASYVVDGEWTDDPTLFAEADEILAMGTAGRVRIRTVAIVANDAAAQQVPVLSEEDEDGSPRDEAPSAAETVTPAELFGDEPLRILLHRRRIEGEDGTVRHVWRGIDGEGRIHHILFGERDAIVVDGTAYLAASVLEAFENAIVFVRGRTSLVDGLRVLRVESLARDESVLEREYLCMVTPGEDGALPRLTAVGFRVGGLERRLPSARFILAVAGLEVLPGMGVEGLRAWVRCRQLDRAVPQGDEAAAAPFTALLAVEPVPAEAFSAWLAEHPLD